MGQLILTYFAVLIICISLINYFQNKYTFRDKNELDIYYVAAFIPALNIVILLVFLALFLAENDQ